MQLRGYYFSVLLSNTTANLSRCFSAPVNAGRRSSRNERATRSAAPDLCPTHRPMDKSALSSYSFLLKNNGLSSFHHCSRRRFIKTYKLRDTNFTGASFPRSLISRSFSRSFRVPQASVSAMMLSLQRRVESQRRRLGLLTAPNPTEDRDHLRQRGLLCQIEK